MYSKDDVELAMDGYKCYLSPVVDCFDGMPAAWSLCRSTPTRPSVRRP